MFGKYKTHRGILARILCIALILFIPISSDSSSVPRQMSLSQERKLTRNVPYKEAASWKRMDQGKNKVDIQRLYDAYRQLSREEGDGSEEEDIGSVKDELLPDEKIKDTIKKIEVNNDVKSIKKESRFPQMIKVKKEHIKEKSPMKSPVVSSMVILKLNVPKHISSKSPAHQDPGERRIAELNRIYHEMMNSFRKSLPISESRRFTGEPSSPSDFIAKPVHLTALTQLINLVQRLEQTDLVGELAKKINDEMEKQTQPILEDIHDVSLVSDNLPMSVAQTMQSQNSDTDTDDINELFDRMDPKRASLVFKRVASEMKAAGPLIKSGCLYDEYKKRLYGILKDQKCTRQSITSDRYPVESESNHKLIDKTTETQLRQGVNKPHKHSNYLRGLETYIKMNKDSQLNGGIRPYYLPNSKNRQLVWNEVPLVKAKASKSSTETANQAAAVSPKLEATDRKLSSSSRLIENRKKPCNIMDLYSGIEPKQIGSGIKALKHSSFFSLLEEYEKQMNDLNQALQAKQRWWKDAWNKDKPTGGIAEQFTPSKSGLTSLQESPNSAIDSGNSFPGVLLGSPAAMNTQQIGGNVIDNLASQMNLSPFELAQRIASAAQGSAPAPSLPQANMASQINVNQMSNASASSKAKFVENSTENQLQAANLAPILDKILQRLEVMQDMKFNQASNQDTTENPLPCCFADPADGSPCDLNGSWESQLLGIRINIRGSQQNKGTDKEETEKPTCAQPKSRTSSDSSLNRHWRQCVKMNSTQIKSMTPGVSSFQWLNVTIQETTPPREHEIIDNISEWAFSGHTLNILGGPISLSGRRADTNLIGTFVGYCRTCGCVDTIFGSWTFCQPSRDCQDITTSIFDRRDMLRRYSMEDKRTNRFKEQLYMRSKFAKVEKNRQQAKQIAFDKVQPFPQPQLHNQSESPNSQPGQSRHPSQLAPHILY